jgi:hypothetical protein
MACEVLRRIGTPRAEFHSHLPPPGANRQTSASSQVQFAGAISAEFRPLGVPWLRSIVLIVDICHLLSELPD